MSDKLWIELRFFLISMLNGAVLLLAYDSLRIIRRVIKHHEIIVAIQDILYWIITSVWIFALIYRENDGIIRAYTILAILLGMILYNYILSKLIITVFVFIIMKTFQPFKFIYNKYLKFMLLRLIKMKNWVKIRTYKKLKGIFIPLKGHDRNNEK